MKNGSFWDITPYVALVKSDVSEELGPSITRITRIGELRKIHGTIFLIIRSVCRLLVTANIPSTPILVTLMMEGLNSSETSVLTRTTLRNITKDDILHSHRRENLKFYTALTSWTLYW
jgi:hypothetical protein